MSTHPFSRLDDVEETLFFSFTGVRTLKDMHVLDWLSQRKSLVGRMNAIILKGQCGNGSGSIVMFCLKQTILFAAEKNLSTAKGRKQYLL